jgi:hypothetical protein
LEIDDQAFSIADQGLDIDDQDFSIDVQGLDIDDQDFSIDVKTLVIDVQSRGAAIQTLRSALPDMRMPVLPLAAEIRMSGGRRTQVVAAIADSFQRALSLLDRRRGVRPAMCVRLASRPLRKKALHVSQFLHFTEGLRPCRRKCELRVFNFGQPHQLWLGCRASDGLRRAELYISGRLHGRHHAVDAHEGDRRGEEYRADAAEGDGIESRKDH